MKYTDLDDAAKAKAREWWKECEAHEWGHTRAPDLYEDMAKCLSFLGITVNQSQRMARYVSGKTATVQEWDFEWSGFWSQGDGLVFRGSWRAENVDYAGLTAHAPQDEDLHEIGQQMLALMLKWPTARARITTVSCGPGLPGLSITDTYSTGDEDGPELPNEDILALHKLVRRACKWCYDTLEANYEYDTSDEAAEEGIEANDYDFTREGEIA